MLVVLRFRLETVGIDEFVGQARVAVEALSRCRGFVDAHIGRAIDDANLGLIELKFDEVGSYRRALSNYDVKMNAVPLLSTVIDEPTAFEVLHHRDTDGCSDSVSALAPDHDTFGIGTV